MNPEGYKGGDMDIQKSIPTGTNGTENANNGIHTANSNGHDNNIE